MMRFISAVASHDLYASVFRGAGHSEANEVRVLRIATFALGVVAVILGIIFRTQNVAYMVDLAYAVAASANIPVLLLTIYWPARPPRDHALAFPACWALIVLDRSPEAVRARVGVGG